jgi:peptide/nickel transport system ATP-binding protein
MRCVPKLGSTKEGSILYPIRGRVPAPKDRPKGACIFAPRCDYATDRCLSEKPGLISYREGHLSRCFYSDEIKPEDWSPSSDMISTFSPQETAPAGEPILKIDDLKTYYDQESKSLLSLVGMAEKLHVKAVDEVSLEVPKGKTLGVVGESGCGKSTLAKTIVGLETPRGGTAEFLGFDLSVPVSERDVKLIQDLQMVFQNPDSTMNPSYTVGQQIGRPLRHLGKMQASEVREEVIRLLNAVRLDGSYYKRLPRQLSGGEKQRVGIARAFASQPELVLCDEPVSALDVSVQAAVLNLLLDIQREHNTTMMFIAHDLSVVRFFSDYVAVMYLGHLVEIGPAENIYSPPYQPYTEALLSAVPIPDPTAEQKHIRLHGTVPSALNPPSGCPFHTRCPRRELLPDGGNICETEEPPWQYNTEEHRIYCHIPLEELRTFDPVVTSR